MPSLLQIRLLGGMRISYGDAPVTGVNTPRLQSLLAYLMLSGGAPQLRLHVAFTLWPDTSESNARNSLRQLLHQLRQSLPDPDRFMAVDGNTICWQKGGEQSVDVWTFESALAEAEAAERGGDVAAAARAWEEAVACYQGDLLPACYDDWIVALRDDLRLRHRHACEKLVRLLEDGRQYEAALRIAERLLNGDPLDEEAQARLMRLHALNGDRAAVRRAFQTADLGFRRELGQPAPASLRELYERLVQAPHGSARARTIGGEDANGAALMLVGRQAEWRRLQSAWRKTGSGEAQLVLIGGEAGIGKSRLAEELYAWVSRQGIAAAYARSYGAEGRLSLSPVTEWLRSPALRVRWEGLDRAWLAEIARLLPELPVERPDLDAPPPIVEAGGRRRFFEALARAVLAAPPPLLLWIDDLHW
ncbi:MAG TPA: AAA family ATPase, partial [Anaerolineae bacterium]